MIRTHLWTYTLWLLLTATATAAIEVVDDAGASLSLEQPAQRIVSLAPSLTELLFAAGAGDKLVGVVEYSDFPEAANQLPRVGRHDSLDMERIVSLQPDLIVAWHTGNPRASINRLRDLGFAVYSAEPKRLTDIPDHIARLAELAGTEAAARIAITEFNTLLSELRATYQNKAPVRTFYQVWNVPLITAGGNELINDIINLCGGENIFADLQLIAPKVSTESVLERDPRAIVASGMDIERPEWLDDWISWPELQAVRDDNLFFVPPDLLQRHTPRALEGAEMLCRQLDAAR